MTFKTFFANKIQPLLPKSSSDKSLQDKISRKRNNAFSDILDMDPEDLEEKHLLSMISAFHDVEENASTLKITNLPKKTVFTPEVEKVSTWLSSYYILSLTRGAFLIRGVEASSTNLNTL